MKKYRIPLLILLLGLAAACSKSLPGSLVILDPVLPVLAPKVAETYGRFGRKTFILSNEASEDLYALLAAETPTILFLSPLLSSEVGRILDSSPGIRLVCLGNRPLAPRTGLYQAGFSTVDSAAVAGSLLASQAQTLPAGALVVGIFPSGAEEAAERFVESYLAGKPGNTPIIEYSPSSWSAAAANRLKALDIRQAYIAISGKDGVRWAREVFAASAYIVLESALGDIPDPSVDALLVWDIETSLKALEQALGSEESASIGGTWRLIGR